MPPDSNRDVPASPDCVQKKGIPAQGREDIKLLRPSSFGNVVLLIS